MIPCKPFIKWVGGKTQLLPELLKRIPAKFNNYYEPFIGAGALFFALQPEKAFVSDINAELVNTYVVIKNELESLISDLAKHRYESKYFYETRNLDRKVEFKNLSACERAGRFIYLNKTCFNGLYRVSAKGYFNVPFGRYTNPCILDADNLRACNKVLQNVSIKCADFLDFEQQISRDDFVYFDPPYAPLNTTSNFTSYHDGGFGIEQQKELASLCERLDKKNIKFMLSNSSAELVLELYKNFKIEFVDARRSVNSNALKRGAIKEVIVRNYD